MTKKTLILLMTIVALMIMILGFYLYKSSVSHTNSFLEIMTFKKIKSKEKCKPLLLFIEGGGFIVDGDSMAKTAEHVRSSDKFSNIKIEYFTNSMFMTPFFKEFDGFFLDTNFNHPKISDTIANLHTEHWPIVVIGWSLGGTSAWIMGRNQGISLLVTLDPVSANDNETTFKKPRAEHWINVYSTKKTSYALAPWRWISGQWGIQVNASRNIPSTYEHDDVHLMFTSYVEEEILTTLKSCKRATGNHPNTDIISTWPALVIFS